MTRLHARSRLWHLDMFAQLIHTLPFFFKFYSLAIISSSG